MQELDQTQELIQMLKDRLKEKESTGVWAPYKFLTEKSKAVERERKGV